jgi:hypothetical protein
MQHTAELRPISAYQTKPLTLKLFSCIAQLSAVN